MHTHTQTYGVPFVPKCLTFCGNLENLAPMKRAVFMISFSFLVNKHLDLLNPCLYLLNRCLDLVNRCLYLLNRCLDLLNRCLYLLNRCLDLVNPCLDLVNNHFCVFHAPSAYDLPHARIRVDPRVGLVIYIYSSLVQLDQVLCYWLTLWRIRRPVHRWIPPLSPM